MAAPASPAKVITPAAESVRAAATASMPRTRIPFFMAFPLFRCRLITSSQLHKPPTSQHMYHRRRGRENPKWRRPRPSSVFSGRQMRRVGPRPRHPEASLRALLRQTGLLSSGAHGSRRAEHRGGTAGGTQRAESCAVRLARVRRGARHGAPPGCGTTRHDLRPRPFTRTGGVRPAGSDRARAGGTGVLGAEERHLRVLVARRMRGPARGLAGLRVQASGATRQGQAVACARRTRQDLRRGVGSHTGRGTAHRQRARGRQEGWSVVGLVRGQDRGGVVARHRRARLP